MATNGGLSDYTDCALDVSVCSTDGEQYQISVVETCGGNDTFAKTVTRSDQTLPTVSFTDVCIMCTQTDTLCNLTIDGTLLPANQVRLSINGTCEGGARVFMEVQIVDLVLGGSCEFGPDGDPVATGP